MNIIENMKKDGKTIDLDGDRYLIRYNKAPDVTFEVELLEDRGGVIYVYYKNDEETLFDDGIDLNLLRKLGVPMNNFFEDFYNKGFSIEDSLANHYHYLTTNPIKNTVGLNAMFNENEDSYQFFYTETNLVFVILKSRPLNEIRIFDYDDEDQECFNRVLSDDELIDNGIELEMFKNEFKGFELVSDDGKESRLI